MVSSSTGEKQGHIFCGFCCDVRRAVIVLNIIGMVVTFCSILFSLLGLTLVDIADDIVHNVNISDISNATTFNDDLFWDNSTNTSMFESANMTEIVEGFDSVKDPVTSIFKIVVVVMIIGFGVHLITFLGAIHYNYYFVSVGVIWSLLNYFIVPGSGLILLTFYLYPHIMFILEIRTGIMSEYTYGVREEHSCCCVTPRYLQYDTVAPTTTKAREFEMV
jgi:hypothetical protein